MKTRRAFLVEPRKFEIRELNIEPASGQLLIKIRGTGICNWEQNHWNGKLGEFPQSLGHEWGGTVVETGKDVTDFKPGDNVTGLSDALDAFSDYIVCKSDRCYKLSCDVDPQYALAEPLKCIVTVLRGVAPEFGDVGVVLGCGPMGLWCIQGMAGRMLSALITVDIDENKLQMAKKFGATHIINSRKTDAEEAIKKITGGGMADFVIEGTGVPKLLEQGARFLKRGRGRLAMMSAYEEISEKFDFHIFCEKSLELRVVHPGYSLDQDEDMRRAVDMINNKVFQVKELVSHQFKLEDIQKAFETCAHKPSDYLKGLVSP